jgi:regulator of sigma D
LTYSSLFSLLKSHHHIKNSRHIENFFQNHKDYRGNKDYRVAQRLLQKVQAELVKRKIKKLFVSTEDTNIRAKSFYARNGFRTEGVL